MILVKDEGAYDIELREILKHTADKLQEDFLANSSLLKLSGTEFEMIVCKALNLLSTDTSFFGKFEQTTAHAFPDIYAKILEKKWFGIEVKTSRGDWKCFGNSIFESTRVPNLEDRIYVFFGKFSEKLECRFSKYDSCIDNINITHSPRYQINMDIENEPLSSVFAKMDITYLDFAKCNTTQRMEYVRKFKREGLGQDVALWWLPDHDNPNYEDEKKLIIKLFSSLSTIEQRQITNEALAFFPEIFSNKNKKYSRIPTWLASRHGVVMGNIRDLFTAGGAWKLEFGGVNYELPRICAHIQDGSREVKILIEDSKHEDILLQWQISECNSLLSGDEKLKHWIEQVYLNLNSQDTMPQNFPIKKWLNSIFN